MSFAFRYCQVQPVAISELCRSSIAATYGLKKEKIPCIYNGIDTEKFRNPEKRTIPKKGNMTFVSVGRLSKQKNYPLLLRVARTVHQKWPNVKFFILGDGELRTTIKEQLMQQESQDYVHFLGSVSDVNRHLWSADAFLMTSDYEGLPLTVLEAMAAGLPIISTKAGGIADVVKHEENGILVDCGDEEGLVLAIDRLCTSPELCSVFSQKSKELSLKYSLKNMAEAYLRIYLA